MKITIFNSHLFRIYFLENILCHFSQCSILSVLSAKFTVEEIVLAYARYDGSTLPHSSCRSKRDLPDPESPVITTPLSAAAYRSRYFCIERHTPVSSPDYQDCHKIHRTCFLYPPQIRLLQPSSRWYAGATLPTDILIWPDRREDARQFGPIGGDS